MTSDSDHPHDSHPSTPWTWRARLGLTVVLLCLFSWFARSWLTPRGQSAIGLIALLTLVAALSTNLRAVNWRTIAAGLILQLGLALFILYTPQGEALFKALGQAVGEFLNFANKGATFVFGFLADGKYLESQFGKDNAFVFAFAALPAIIFVSSFFAILYYFGIIQFIVKILARSMMKIMGTSGAETLSSAANVFMGQTEAPLIVRPYVKRMTESELLALMAGGMATVSGAMIVLYATYGADTTAVLATSVMAAPCALYLSKLLVPETETPATRGEVKMELEKEYRNPIDAAASGALGGLQLALNVAAVLIAFIALVAMVDYLLQQIDPELSLSAIFSVLFTPACRKRILVTSPGRSARSSRSTSWSPSRS